MKYFTTVFIVFLSISCLGVKIDKNLLRAISKVESNNKELAVGDSGKAYGAFQLHKIYIDDVNRFSAKKYRRTDAFNKKLAEEIVVKYLQHYGKRYERITGQSASREVLARIHNGGPDGWKKSSTIKYWKKIKSAGNFKE